MTPLYNEKLSNFFKNFGVSWDEVEQKWSAVKPTRESNEVFLAWLSQKTQKRAPYFREWFELGRMTSGIANLARDHSPEFTNSLAEYRSYMEAAVVDLQERDEIETLLKELEKNAPAEAESCLTKIGERLRFQAQQMDKSTDMVREQLNVVHRGERVAAFYFWRRLSVRDPCFGDRLPTSHSVPSFRFSNRLGGGSRRRYGFHSGLPGS